MKKKGLLWLVALSLVLGMGIGRAASDATLGDIVFSDGTIVHVQDLSAWTEDCFPVAVVAAIREDGSILGLGTQRSEEALPWAAEGSAGEAIHFSALESRMEGSSEGHADRAVFSGALDGRDSWRAVCAEDARGAADAARCYPAFDFVNTYAERQGLTEDMAAGWYLPSIAELCAIYQNSEAVSRSLEAIHALDGGAAMDGLGTNWYWSSSQSAIRGDCAWFVHYFNGYVCDCPKNFTNLHALAVKRF